MVVVLIPEKEQVYRDALPVRFNPPDNPLPPSVLWAVESELQRHGIPVVNMLDSFQNATLQGELVYWQDDTHWNERGTAMAVERVWSEIENLFVEP